MESVIENKSITNAIGKENLCDNVSLLAEANINTEYIVKKIDTNDSALKAFLFTLGCYEGESITIISKLADNFVISVKDARYSIDTELARAILI